MSYSKSVLLVEDDDDDQFFFTEALSEIENAILYAIAKNGSEALNLLINATKLPDLIFLDLNMPVMTGIDLLHEIIKIPQIKEIPVVILSTGTTHIDLVQELGAKAYIKKPADPDILRSKLEHMINLDFITNAKAASETFKSVLEEK